MELHAAVVNTYAYVGQDFQNVYYVTEYNTRGKIRGRSLVQLFSLFGVYASAEKICLAHATSHKRAQCDRVVAAIAPKDAAQATAHHDVAMPKELPKGAAKTIARIHPDLRELSNDGECHSKLCKKRLSFANCGRHCAIWHKETNDSIVKKDAHSDSGTVDHEDWPLLEKK